MLNSTLEIVAVCDACERSQVSKIFFVSCYVHSTFFSKTLAEQIFIVEYLQALTKQLHQAESIENRFTYPLFLTQRSFS
jgi:hypothetical protein